MAKKITHGSIGGRKCRVTFRNCELKFANRFELELEGNGSTARVLLDKSAARELIGILADVINDEPTEQPSHVIEGDASDFLQIIT